MTRCRRKACQADGATATHRGTRELYCIPCAMRINAACGEQVLTWKPTERPPWHPLGVLWTGSGWAPYTTRAPEARYIYAVVERFCDPPWDRDRPRHEICEVSGPGWRGFLRALRPYLLRGYTVRGGIGWSDIMNAGRDSAGN